MREIKFRAWAKQYQEHKMYYFKLGSAYDDDYRTYLKCEGDEDLKQCRLKDEDCVVMQYTGLKDKNGKEIYEGDIVKLNDEHRKVVFAEGGWVLQTTYKQEFNGGFSPKFLHRHFHDYMEAPDRLFVEVIGNIYENQNLLTNNN